MSQNPYIQGYLPVKALYENIMYGTPLESVDTGIVKVDDSNVQEYLDRLEAGDVTVG